MKRARASLVALGRIATVLGLVALFAASATAALLLHLNLPAARRATASLLDRALAGRFHGEVRIGSITKVSASQLWASDIVVRDETHRVVLKVNRLNVAADLLDILRHVLWGGDKLTIVIGHLRIERAEAAILPAGDGLPTLARALTPRDSASTPEPSRYVLVWLPEVEIGHAFARGSLGGQPVLEAEVTGAHGSVLVTPKGAAVDVPRFALLVRGLGGADAKGVASLHVRAPGAVWSSLDGYLGDVQFGSVLRWDKQALDLKVNVPRAEPAAVRAVLAEWPLLVDAEASLSLKGKPSSLDVALDAKLGAAASLTSRGTLKLAGEPALQLDIAGRQLDLRSLWALAPATSLNADAKLGLRSEAGKLVVEVGGALAPTQINGQHLPSIDVTGSSTSGKFTAKARVHELNVPLDLTASVHPNGTLELSAEARRVDLAKVERLRPYLSAKGQADLRAQATLRRDALEASVTLELRGLEYQGITLDSGRVLASVKGSTERPKQLALNASLVGKELRAGRFSFAGVRAFAHGPLLQPSLRAELSDQAGPNLDVSAQLASATPLSLRALSVGLSRNGVAIQGQIAELELSAGRVMVRELTLHGAAGELSGNAELTPKALNASLHGRALDLSALSRILGLPRGTLEGRMDVLARVTSAGGTEAGELSLVLREASLGNLNGISGELSAKLSGAELTGSSQGRVEALGDFSANWSAVLAGSVLDPAAFAGITGNLELALQRVTLDYVGQLVPNKDLDVGGQANVTLKLSRSAKDAVPNLELSAQTQGLQVALERGADAPLQFSGIELLLGATHEGSTGLTAASLGAERGAERLVAATADMTLDLKAALSGEQPLAKQLLTRQFLGKAVLSQSRLEDLPAPLRVPGLRGSVRVETTLRGSLAQPVVAVALRAKELQLSDHGRGDLVDLCGTAEYAKSSGDFSVGAELFLPVGLPQISPSEARAGAARSCSGQRFASVRASGRAPFTPKGASGAWTGTVLASLEALPLSAVPALADARLTGSVTGTLQLDRNPNATFATSQLQLKDVRMDRRDLGSGRIDLRTRANLAHADFELKHGQASLTGSLHAGLDWSSELPALDAAQPIRANLSARNLDASLLGPLLSDVVSDLEGTLTANLQARLEPLRPGETERAVAQLAGDLGLKDGSFVFTSLGFRLRQVGFSATAKNDGPTSVISVPDLTATASAKSQNMSANANFRLAGTALVSGSANLTIRDLPLVVDGVTRANADADARLVIERRPEKMFAEVFFTRLHAKLPSAASRELTGLGENENVRVLQPLSEPKAARETSALPWHFVIHLGNEARLTRGVLLNLPIDGDPNVVLARDLGVTGTVSLRQGGSVQMLQKVFLIEAGAVFFDTADPADPRLDVVASWRAPDGNVLFVRVTGTLTRPKLAFDRPDAEAWALLMGDGALGGNALDSLLSDTPLSRVQLRASSAAQDSSQPGSATYTAAYRASDRFVVEGNYQGARSGGDSDQGGNVSAAFEYRFGPRWSIRTEVGTIGTGVDLLYQFRY